MVRGEYLRVEKVTCRLTFGRWTLGDGTMTASVFGAHESAAQHEADGRSVTAR